MKYHQITIELDQHTGEFYIDISIYDRWFTFNPEERPVAHNELVACRTFEYEQGVRWATDSEYEADVMSKLVQEAFDEGVKNIDTDPEFAVMQFDYIVSANYYPALSYAGM